MEKSGKIVRFLGKNLFGFKKVDTNDARKDRQKEALDWQKWRAGNKRQVKKFNFMTLSKKNTLFGNVRLIFLIKLAKTY